VSFASRDKARKHTFRLQLLVYCSPPVVVPQDVRIFVHMSFATTEQSIKHTLSLQLPPHSPPSPPTVL
jgi:hypothetical protein